MLINLTKSVPLKELCKISAIGKAAEKEEWIEFSFSKEALLGFATELIWLYEDIHENTTHTICTHQLQVNPAPNQVLGFYLTPNSPMFVLKTNSLLQNEAVLYEYQGWKEISIKGKNENQYYYIKEPTKENEFELQGKICLEPYELAKRNILNIKIMNSAGDDITREYHTVVLEINRKGLLELATMLLVLANNYQEGAEYLLAHREQVEYQYNLGVMLTSDSIQTKLKCANLGNVYDYDERI